MKKVLELFLDSKILIFFKIIHFFIPCTIQNYFGSIIFNRKLNHNQEFKVQNMILTILI